MRWKYIFGGNNLMNLNIIQTSHCIIREEKAKIENKKIHQFDRKATARNNALH